MKKLVITFFFLFSITIYKAQNIYAFAGTGVAGFSGDGGIATSAQFDNLGGIGVDTQGNVYAADGNSNRIRKINTSGIISTFAGTGVNGFSGDGGLAVNAQLNYPTDVICDAAGNVYIYDSYNYRIRKINTLGIITTIAGDGNYGAGGDGGPATSAQVSNVSRIAVDIAGNIYLAQRQDNIVRKINTSGVITTVAGTGVNGFSGDGGAATSAQLAYPRSIAVDAAGNLFIGEDYSSRIRKVNTAGVISTYAGNGTPGDAGDGGQVANAQVSTNEGLSFDAAGNLYIASFINASVRKVNTSGIITTVAGGTLGIDAGNGGPAINATVNPSGLVVDGTGNIFIPSTQYIREVCIGSCVSGIHSQTENDHLISVFPNPNKGSFKIKIDNTVDNCRLTILNSIGQKVSEHTLYTGENNIIASDLAKGLYTYVITENKTQIRNGKLIIE